MKITNTGTKIINVGAVAVLPGESSPELPASFKGNPTLALFQKKGFITIDDGAAAEEAAEVETEVKAKAKAAAKTAADKEAAEKAAAEKKAAEEIAKKKTAEEKKVAEEAAKAAAGSK